MLSLSPTVKSLKPAPVSPFLWDPEAPPSLTLLAAPLRASSSLALSLASKADWGPLLFGELLGYTLDLLIEFWRRKALTFNRCRLSSLSASFFCRFSSFALSTSISSSISFYSLYCLLNSLSFLAARFAMKKEATPMLFPESTAFFSFEASPPWLSSV